MRIELPIVDLEEQKILEKKDAYLVLENDHVEFKLEFKSNDQDDATKAWEETNHFIHYFCRRENVVSSELKWLEDSKRWKLTISVHPENYIRLYFKKRVEIDPVFETVTNYILGKPYSPVKTGNIFL